jgi:hypothetical protein
MYVDFPEHGIDARLMFQPHGFPTMVFYEAGRKALSM